MDRRLATSLPEKMASRWWCSNHGGGSSPQRQANAESAKCAKVTRQHPWRNRCVLCALGACKGIVEEFLDGRGAGSYSVGGTETDERDFLEEYMAQPYKKPSAAFVGAAWLALFLGVLGFCVGLWNATALQLNEKGYFFTLLMYGLFAAVSLQKSVRDRLEGIPVTNIYYGLCWFSLLLTILLTAVGLWNASIALSEKGFYGMAFLLSLFGAITVQKNVRDTVGAEVEEIAS
jgi:uncharacterized membrane protein YiaA